MKNIRRRIYKKCLIIKRKISLMNHKKQKPYKITTLTNNDNQKLLEIHFFR